MQADAEGAKVAALSSVVTGKEVESDAIALHRELQCESLLFCLTRAAATYSTQTEMSKIRDWKQIQEQQTDMFE